MAIKEYLIESNKFQTPKVLKDKDATAMLLLRLLLLEPGTSQVRPDMGIGIVSRYRYTDESKLENLRSDIANQISKYLPNFMGASIEVNLNNQNELLVNITVDGTMYSFETTESGVSLLQL